MSKKKKNCKVTNWGMTASTELSTLTFKVPKPSKSFPVGTYQLKVVNKIETVTAITDFTIEEPLP